MIIFIFIKALFLGIKEIPHIFIEEIKEYRRKKECFKYIKNGQWAQWVEKESKRIREEQQKNGLW